MSDLKLYRVDWSGECYVMAKSIREAERIVLDELGCQGEDMGICADASAEDANCTPMPEWMGAIPYNSPDDRTVAGVIEDMKEARDADES